MTPVEALIEDVVTKSTKAGDVFEIAAKIDGKNVRLSTFKSEIGNRATLLRGQTALVVYTEQTKPSDDGTRVFVNRYLDSIEPRTAANWPPASAPASSGGGGMTVETQQRVTRLSAISTAANYGAGVGLNEDAVFELAQEIYDWAMTGERSEPVAPTYSAPEPAQSYASDQDIPF